MSLKNGKDYLYLIWKCAATRRQYIIGQLTKNGHYEFQYGEEIEEALKAGFQLLVPFEDISRTYECEELFPVFASRLPDKKRKDIHKILKKYGLDKYDPYQLLKKSGARLPIDNLQFIDPILDFDHAFEKGFYVAGARHYLGCNGEDCETALLLMCGEEVFLKREEENQYDHNAICVVNHAQKVLGYVPRYYTQAFLRFSKEKRLGKCQIESMEKGEYCDMCIRVIVKILDKN